MYRILIVEDDMGIASAMKKQIEMWDLEVRCVENFRNVLTAKIQAILRRTYDFGGQMTILQHRGAMLNTSDASLTYNGDRIELTKNDYRILRTLMENKGKVVSRDTLMERLWETDSFVDENALTVNIARLRKKLEQVGLSDFILTKKGMGYLIG